MCTHLTETPIRILAEDAVFIDLHLGKNNQHEAYYERHQEDDETTFIPFWIPDMYLLRQPRRLGFPMLFPLYSVGICAGCATNDEEHAENQCDHDRKQEP